MLEPAVLTQILPNIVGLLSRLRARLAARPDSEHEMSVNRLGFLLLMALYLWAAPVAKQRFALMAMGCGLVVTLESLPTSSGGRQPTTSVAASPCVPISAQSIS